DVGVPLVVAEVEDLDDARIGDGGRGPGLVEEARHDLGLGGEPGVQHLDGRAPPEHRVLRDPDLAHSAGADPLEDPVCTNLRAGDHRYDSTDVASTASSRGQADTDLPRHLVGRGGRPRREKLGPGRATQTERASPVTWIQSTLVARAGPATSVHEPPAQ